LTVTLGNFRLHPGIVRFREKPLELNRIVTGVAGGSAKGMHVHKG